MNKPRLFVRVVEAHATRTWVAVILAASAGLSLVLLTASAMVNTLANPGVTDLSPNFSSAITATLGVLVGSLATYVGTSPKAEPGPGEPFGDDEVVLNVEHPQDPEPTPPPV